MWLFGTHGEFVDAEAQQPAAGPYGLQRYDPGGFELVGSIYSATHPLLQATPPPPERLRPASDDARSQPDPGDEDSADGGHDACADDAANPEMEGYHLEVECDKSGMCPIVGTRYRLTGHNWDLCAAELAKLPEVEQAQYEAIGPPRYRPKTETSQVGGNQGGNKGEEEVGEAATAWVALVATATVEEDRPEEKSSGAAEVGDALAAAAAPVRNGTVGNGTAAAAAHVGNGTASFGSRVLELDNSHGEQAVTNRCPCAWTCARTRTCTTMSGQARVMAREAHRLMITCACACA